MVIIYKSVGEKENMQHSSRPLDETRTKCSFTINPFGGAPDVFFTISGGVAHDKCRVLSNMFCHKHSDSGKRPLLGKLRGVLYILFIHIANAGYF